MSWKRAWADAPPPRRTSWREIKEANIAYQKAMKGEAVILEEAEGYQTAILLHLGREYHRLNIAMQLHYSCLRILCNLIGGWVENGEYPNNDKALREIVEGISFTNAARYFNL